MEIPKPIELVLNSGETLVLRTSTLADVQDLTRAFESVVAEVAFLLPEPGELDLSLDSQRQWVRDKQLSPEDVHWVLLHQREIIGAIGLTRGTPKRRRHTALIGLYVIKSWRGKGAGKAMVQAVIDWARNQTDIEKISLEVFSHNHRAIKLYEQLGFVEEGRRLRHIKTATGQYFDELFMSLQLNPAQ